MVAATATAAAVAVIGTTIAFLDRSIETADINIGDGWDSFTSQDSQYPPAEISREKREEWGYGSVVKDITEFPPKELDDSFDESRTPINMDKSGLDAFGQIRVIMRKFDDDSGYFLGPERVFHCSAQNAILEGFRVRGNADIMLSAGHCFDMVHPETKVHYKAVSATFLTNYVDINGVLQKFESELNWGSLRYLTLDHKSDIAIATLVTGMPDNIEPAHGLVDYKFNVNEPLVSGSFPGDKQGGHIDNCEVISVESSWVINTCGVQEGASGGFLSVSNVDEKIVFPAIASFSYPDTDDDHSETKAGHSLIPSFFLEQISYLERDSNASVSAQGLPCLRVTTESKVHLGAGTGFNEVAEIPNGGIVHNLGPVGDWSFIRYNGQGGYIARRHDGKTLVKPVSCP